uniref:hypothetical protein n=1 Tax=Chloroflexus sp. TaxID=1904827 RepID=UPI002ACE916E
MERTFEQLQVDILSAVETIYLKKNQLMLHLPYWWHVFQRVMAAGVITAFAIGAFVLIWPLSPNAWTRLNWFLGGLFPGQVGNLFFIALFVGIVIGIVIVLPVFLISGVRFAKLREMLWIVYFVGFMPSGFGAGQWFLQDLFWGSADIVSVITYWSVLANMFSYLITMLIVLVSSGVSYIFFFVLGRPIHREQQSFIPSFDQIVFRVIEQVKDKDTIKDLHLDQINALQGMAQRKHASLGVQSQTVASLVATFSLFGLVALFFTQEDLR